MDRLGINFSIIFGIIGLIVSVIFSLFSKNPISVIITDVLISTIIALILGFVVYTILKQKVPELLEIFGDFTSSPNSIKGTEWEDSYDYGEELEDTSGQEMNYEESDLTANKEINVEEEKPILEKPKHFGDHILVDKIAIKNEPKLMAEAIRTMLSKDD